MANARQYLSVAYPNRWTICGVRMQPFSLGHKMLMAQIESPLESGGSAGIADVVLALLVCSKPYSAALAFAQSDTLTQTVERWAAHYISQNPECDWTEKSELFTKYISEHSAQPIYSVDENRVGDASGCPLFQLVKVTLMCRMGFSEQEIMNRCWGLCLWDFITLREIDGVVRIVDKDAEVELLRKAAQ